MTTLTRLAEVGRSEIAVAGVPTSFLHAGQADADEAVVFLHGNPGPAEDWRRLVSRTGAFARAVAPDMPGFGESDKPDRFVYTVDGYARHLQVFLDELGIRRVHLVLHDFGGPWGLTWAADHQEQCASLTLVDIGVMRDYSWHSLARIWRTTGLGEAFMATTTLPAIKAHLRRGNPRGMPLDAVERIYRASRDRAACRAVLRLYRATDLAAVSEDLHRRLRGFDRPVLVLWGARDPYTPVRWAERQRETFPRAQVVVLDDSGHWPMLDNPVAVEQLVTEFLTGATAPGRAEGPVS
ncbi:alpha/beta fold hydrolase [Blastococcus sp. SYSU DS0669]